MEKRIKQYLECGKVLSTHGIDGEIRIENWCDSPETIANMKTIYYSENGEFKPLKILDSFVQKNMAVVSLEGIDTLEKAIALKETILYCNRDDIPLKKGKYFLSDMIGLPVIDINNGYSYGKVTDMDSAHSQTMIVVQNDEGKHFMIPDVSAFVKEVIIEDSEKENAVIKVDLPEGLSDATY